MDRVTKAPALEDLSLDECMRLLADSTVGRFAVATPGAAPLVVPVNYLLDGDAVVFRSGPGSKLRGLRGLPVSFEVDRIDEVRHTGWSVLLRGRAYEATRWEVEHLHLETWVPGDKGHWVRIVPEGISGRRIRHTEELAGIDDLIA
ncbi:MAG TPA: pyridoxamine 5'-phosphate oxidase family protein [Acidimicrobiales bacterium]|nr:pyridoxamine 5'-phosphate oxidase family protein [Acidimicrobiales bacterium]